MFGFFKNDEKEDEKSETGIIENPVFGKLKYIHTWWSFDRIDVTMFGKTYSITYSVASNEQKEAPDSIQEETFKRFMSEKEKFQSKVEKVVSEELGLDGTFDIGEVINVTRLCISRDGKCGIEMEIREEYLDEIDLDELDIIPDNSFGVAVLPELYIIKSSDRFSEIFVEQK
ncbi:MAG: hypothetical protein K6G24_04210 [Lachnospiraceae bacterium]|nr:hypothetical protein [Lachnospiraceae bacterium]